MSLTDLARLKPMLGIPLGVTYHDTAMGLAVDFGNSYVLEAIGQPQGLVAATFTDYPEVASSASYDIQLEHVPVVAIVGVTNGGAAVLSANYRLDPVTGRVRLSQGATVGYWSPAPDGVVVEYTAGWTEVTVKDQLRRAADLIAASSFNKGTHQGKLKVRNAGHTTDFDLMEIPEAAQLVLNQYEKIHHFG